MAEGSKNDIRQIKAGSLPGGPEMADVIHKVREFGSDRNRTTPSGGAEVKPGKKGRKFELGLSPLDIPSGDELGRIAREGNKNE